MTQSARGWLCLACGHLEPGPAGLADRAGQPVPTGQPAPAVTDPAPAPTPAATPAAAPFVPGEPAPLTSGSGPGELPQPKRGRRFPRKALLLTIGLLLVVGLAAAAGYLFFLAPQSALSAYLGRLVAAKTATFASDVSYDYDGGRFSIKLSGKYDLTDKSKPAADVSVNGTSSSTGVVVTPASQGSIAGQLRLLSQVVYFKIESFSLLSAFFPTKIPNDWYKYDLGSSGDSANKCLDNKKDSGALFGSSILTRIPVKGAAFKGIETINGSPMLHFVGTVDNSKIKQAVDDANKKLPADCQLDLSADDFKTLTISYDLWRGWSKDRLRVSTSDSSDSKSKTAETFDTGSYNQPAKIEAPSGAKDASELLTAFEGGTDDTQSPDTTRTNVPHTTATAQQKAHDTQRKTDLTTIRKGLEEYFVNNNMYPNKLADLTKGDASSPPIFKTIPTDPTGKSPYVYTYTPANSATTYTLSACLENAADTGANVINPVAPCTTATFELTNAN